jgi:hypothetical protein
MVQLHQDHQGSRQSHAVNRVAAVPNGRCCERTYQTETGHLIYLGRLQSNRDSQTLRSVHGEDAKDVSSARHWVHCFNSSEMDNGDKACSS